MTVSPDILPDLDTRFPRPGESNAKRTPPTSRACAYGPCSIQFTPRRSDARYCSGACRAAASRQDDADRWWESLTQEERDEHRKCIPRLAQKGADELYRDTFGEAAAEMLIRAREAVRVVEPIREAMELAGLVEPGGDLLAALNTVLAEHGELVQDRVRRKGRALRSRRFIAARRSKVCRGR